MSPFGKTRALRSRLVTKLATAALILAAAASARAQTPVVFGDVITEPGVYYLKGNQSGSGYGIRIESDDVTLLLTRFTLRGDGTETGIQVLDHDNVNIWGGRVTNFEVGVKLVEGDHCMVKDVRIDHHATVGLVMLLMQDTRIQRVRADHNGLDGVGASFCRDTRLVSVWAHENRRDGILIRDALELGTLADGIGSGTPVGIKARLCSAANNGRDGIRLRNAHDHELKSNQCVGNNDAGIRLDIIEDDLPVSSPAEPEPSPTRDNHLEDNWCVFNADGIVAEWNARGNRIVNNTALANHGHDLVEKNDELPCANTWFLNFFLTRDGSGESCIF